MAVDEGEGFYFDRASAMLPHYIVPGFGFVVLRDLTCDGLIVDGVELADPKSAPHPHFRGGFRGYFNAPPGRHRIVAVLGERRATWDLELAPNAAAVRRLDYDTARWVDDEPDVAAHYQALARSGSMLQAGALRPWPGASLFFEGAPERVWIEGRVVPSSAPRGFFGVTGVPPGDRRVVVGAAELSLTLPLDCIALISCTGSEPELRDPRLGTAMIRVQMMRARREALLPFDALTPAAHHAQSAQDNLDLLTQALGGGGGERRFGAADLDALRRGFAALQASPSEATLGVYVQVLRRCYVIDREMAAQAEFFARYAAEVLTQVSAMPVLKQTAAMTYLRYLAEDLQDTGVESLGALGRRLAAALS